MTGRLNVTVDDSPGRENATVLVEMKDIGDQAMRAANVCLVRLDEDEGGGWGLAIAVSRIDISPLDHVLISDLRFPTTQMKLTTSLTFN